MPTRWIYQTFSDPKLLTPTAMAWLKTFTPDQQRIAHAIAWHDFNIAATYPDGQRALILEQWKRAYYS